ncbi:MAG: creatininase family protein [Tepidisphaeraceae bacterium]
MVVLQRLVDEADPHGHAGQCSSPAPEGKTRCNAPAVALHHAPGEEPSHEQTRRRGDHASELETSLIQHLAPEWVAPLDTAGDGAITPFKLKALEAPGVWVTRDWRAFTQDTGAGDPSGATPEKGRRAFQMLVDAIVPVLVELSAAKEGDFPFVVPKPRRDEGR